MPTLNVCPFDLDLCFTRGDTEPFSFALVDDSTPAAAIPITGFSFLLTANTEQDPINDDNQLFQLSGFIGADPLLGIVTFSPIVATFLNAGDFFFDVEQTDASSKIRTIIKGKLEIRQDITKPAP